MDCTALSLRRVAERVTLEAAEYLRDLPRPDVVAVSTKSSPTDVVSAADTAVEALLRHRLAELCPGDAVVGEEDGGAADTDTIWLVDPIDGTVNYVHGLPWYAVSVGAVRCGVPVAGAVAEPVSGRLWSAAVGAGATCDGRPLRVSAISDVALSVLGTGFSYRSQRRVGQARLVAALLPRVGDVRRTGSAALDMCSVAAGWLDAYLEHGTNWWDWAAAAVIAREAGAVVRVPGPPGAQPPDEEARTYSSSDIAGLGADAVFAAAPGIAADLAALARACGAAAV
ncbi:MAG: inositol monophosphatase family protein [Pseudonocardia sp.]